MAIKRTGWRYAAGAIALIGMAGAAGAQIGASWATGDGAMTTLTMGGSDEPLPAPVAIAPDDMARLFKRLCLDTNGDPTAIEAAAASASPALTAAPMKVKAGKDKPDIQLRLWRGPGIVVAQADGFFAVPEAQCNITFYPTALPDAAVLATALGAAIGTGPSNAAEAVKGNGKPNKNYVPVWVVGTAPAPSRRVSAVAMHGNQYTPGDRVLFAARVPAK
jgi:hypothetical protein